MRLVVEADGGDVIRRRPRAGEREELAYEVRPFGRVGAGRVEVHLRAGEGGDRDRVHRRPAGDRAARGRRAARSGPARARCGCSGRRRQSARPNATSSSAASRRRIEPPMPPPYRPRNSRVGSAPRAASSTRSAVRRPSDIRSTSTGRVGWRSSTTISSWSASSGSSPVEEPSTLGRQGDRRVVRTKRGVPSRASSLPMSRDSACCATNSRAAARVKWSSSATATKERRRPDVEVDVGRGRLRIHALAMLVERVQVLDVGGVGREGRGHHFRRHRTKERTRWIPPPSAPRSSDSTRSATTKTSTSGPSCAANGGDVASASPASGWRTRSDGPPRSSKPRQSRDGSRV